MNTLFVVLIWTFGYYLFFHPLNGFELIWKTVDPIYREFADGYDGDGDNDF
jgi:hypothetical protein